jgi:hypothetical protein
MMWFTAQAAPGKQGSNTTSRRFLKKPHFKIIIGAWDIAMEGAKLEDHEEL